MLPRLQPLIDRAFGVPGSRQVMGEQFRLALDQIGEMLFQRRRDARVQFLPSPAQEGRVGCVLHQRVLEQVGGVRSGAVAEQQSRIPELIQSPK
jgi:hypothetical protein